MLNHKLSRWTLALTFAGAMMAFGVAQAAAQTKVTRKQPTATKGAAQSKRPVTQPPGTTVKPRGTVVQTTPVRPGVRTPKRYVRTHRDYGHVRVVERTPIVRRRVETRQVIVRSARVSPIIIERFPPARRDHLHSVIRLFREGRRPEALKVWATFVGGLRDYDEPVDLDDVMLYVARESSFYEDTDVLLSAARLEQLEEREERLESYVRQLHDLRSDCERGVRNCSGATAYNIENEIRNAHADLLAARADVARAQTLFEVAIAAAERDEDRFATVLDGLYAEVEVRVRVTP